MAKRAAEVWIVSVLRCADGTLYTGITKEKGQLEPECAAIQFTGDPPALAVASST